NPSRWMYRTLTENVFRHHLDYRSSGHVRQECDATLWRGRWKRSGKLCRAGRLFLHCRCGARHLVSRWRLRLLASLRSAELLGPRYNTAGETRAPGGAASARFVLSEEQTRMALHEITEQTRVEHELLQ